MANDNKRNLLYFESPSVKGLYATIDDWQKENRKRMQSVSIHKDGEMFCCIALTNPSEVCIVESGGDEAYVFQHGLRVSNDN